MDATVTRAAAALRGSCSMTGPPGVRAELADLGVSVAGYELPLIAALEPRGVVV
ncbi:MAG: hypothetical protein WAK83_23195 [Trebonia sp.]|jgi:hypothetical protein|uniref:hypothetical protein n=1 Tax=Trebonia sp. TaxID=2767075 RepID=UPI003BB02738